MATIIDGKALSQKKRENIARDAASFAQRYNRKPGLAVILAGDDPASAIYVKGKKKACADTGIQSFDYLLKKTVTQRELLDLIDELNAKKEVDGILVQLPIPDGLDSGEIIERIAPDKDVDGFHPYNLGKLLAGLPTLVSCTPSGIMAMFKEYNIDIASKDAVIIGRSNMVGKPMAVLLMMQHATVTICHSHTKNLEDRVKSADIVVAATGQAHMIKGHWIKDGAVVIDVGITRTENGLKGDIEFDEAVKHASFITPVPGGVGPMTITMLLENTLIAAKRHMS
ncbi:MAG: bifunctional methylenetetrahydrofolate dehydrogenase/methenyltetrahydrofolate cyclohydrolase FolD [Thermodesulfobacteriota bacterium]|nr:bifunctional methylenetetrahydrofolate dehydrogenase/methenyltetrahydrofolate cyclohydrolase FolD [Thermodesulfobacteriota bacterium]